MHRYCCIKAGDNYPRDGPKLRENVLYGVVFSLVDIRYVSRSLPKCALDGLNTGGELVRMQLNVVYEDCHPLLGAAEGALGKIQ